MGDLLFHTDIARDFLLIQDIAVNHKLTLIGPRAGGIPGIFFGPIWLYLNLPVFILGNGNPIVVGYFWVLLFLISAWFVYYVARKVFSVAIGIISTSIFIYTITFLAPGYTQSFGPIIISPLFIYLVYLFIEMKRAKYLCWTVIVCGIIFQLQPAFGSIIITITFILSLILLIKRKQIKFLLVWFLLIIPLSTYILFEVKHNFLETYALYNFIFHNNRYVTNGISFSDLAQNRLGGFLDSINLININNWIFNLVFIFLNVSIVFLWIKSKDSGQRTFILLIYIYILGFWLITFLFRGFVYDYYYWGFYPILAISLASLYLKIHKGIFFILFVCVILFMAKNSYATVQKWQKTIYAQDVSSWIVNKEVADYIFQHVNGDFGYYVYSPDQFGYSMKYAMSYVNRTDSLGNYGTLCKKAKTTFLIYNPTGDNLYNDPVYWKIHKVKITSAPVLKQTIHHIYIEKYILTPKQVAIASDPNLICNLQFR